MKYLDQPTPTTATRERLLEAAEALVYSGGIHGTGIDAVVERSGVARKTLYKNFGSKESLIAAALERRDYRWIRWFVEGTLSRADRPYERLLVMFEVLHDSFKSPDFHGCAFLNAAEEITSKTDRIRVIARAHKEKLTAFILEQCIELVETIAANIDKATRHRIGMSLTDHWMILLDGATSVAMISGDPNSAFVAQHSARLLLDIAVDTPTHLLCTRLGRPIAATHVEI
ncbi:TetR/AcrR family transcriptional regulator [Paraburkholderia caribensis]|uniref:TetR/AcrR family transcriptional regulator n=1 Tax=Paraburkholderia caribensis TaxID=75105 RepID=UPI0034D25039